LVAHVREVPAVPIPDLALLELTGSYSEQVVRRLMSDWGTIVEMERTEVATPEMAEAFLTQRFGAVGEVTPLTSGAWSQAFTFQTDAHDLVIRFGEHGDDDEKDRIAGSWNHPGLPVPHVLEVGSAFGGAYAISERVEGSPIEGLDGVGWQQSLPSLFKVLEALRDIELPGAGFGRWRPDGSAPHRSWRDSLLAIADGPADSRIHGWREALTAVPDREAHFNAGYDRLLELVPACPEVRHVVHGDLTAGNTLVADGTVTGVIDWGNSLAGDPLYDVAWLTYWAPWHPGCAGIDLHAMAKQRFDDGNFDLRVRCYEIHIGLDAQQYNAFSRRWDMLNATAERTLQLAAQ
jgi:hygromycin-B 4-O-kinase